MKTKIFSILLGIFFIQFISSCCDCVEPVDYNLKYSSLTVTPVDTSGFIAQPVTDSLFKNSFGLEVNINSERTRIGKVNSIKSLGFSSSYACSCDDDTYTILDSITSIEITMINQITQEDKNVTTLFKASDYSNGSAQLIDIKKLFNNRINYYGIEYLRLELVEFDNVTDLVSFTVDVYFQSGRQFSETTETIHFFPD